MSSLSRAHNFQHKHNIQQMPPNNHLSIHFLVAYLDLWCGKVFLENKSLDAFMAMASVANWLEMTEVGLALAHRLLTSGGDHWAAERGSMRGRSDGRREAGTEASAGCGS